MFSNKELELKHLDVLHVVTMVTMMITKRKTLELIILLHQMIDTFSDEADCLEVIVRKWKHITNFVTIPDMQRQVTDMWAYFGLHDEDNHRDKQSSSDSSAVLQR